MAENEGKAKRPRRKTSATTQPSTVAFDYIKSNYFRVIHCDGVIGGITANGLIHLAAWSSRQPYPKKVVHELTPEGTVGSEIDRVMRETDVIREVEAGLVFSPALARAIVKWLEDQLAVLKSIDEAEPKEPTETEE